eukprot:Gregarina_sp_Pseudo_9__980@NODE_162_length_3907_cov_15_700879_g149_i0_p1_GENE_NODE_162_length_3907_cov_15_700879_g149_i0NODE_162_length_3907_cov_15_700879_g149_i0_p1_ORF_typecomplete_len249_score48_31_NODE_162_length_3907_cov_15_700879_g149_i022883034
MTLLLSSSSMHGQLQPLGAAPMNQMAEAEPVVMNNPALESILYHLQSCYICKEQLVVGAQEESNMYGDCSSVAAAIEIISALSHCLSSEASPPAGTAGEAVPATSSRSKPSCRYERGRECLARRLAHGGKAGVLLKPQTNVDGPLLKRQNAFERMNTQASFESTSADTNTDGLGDVETEAEFDDADGSALLIGHAFPRMMAPSREQYLEDLLRQNAFEIPAGAEEKEWNKYLNDAVPATGILTTNPNE